MQRYSRYLSNHPDAKLLVLMPENTFCAKGDLTNFDQASKQRNIEFLKEISIELASGLFIVGKLKIL